MSHTLLHGDCLDVLRTLPSASVDAVVTDPPYGLSFMGKRWDYDVPSVEVWQECLRVLKPGGHLLAFAGTRTQHRMAVRIEDAGFEIRDMIAWVYGSGFPKSLDVSKAIDKIGGIDSAQFKAELANAVYRSGKSRADIDAECGFTMKFDVPYEKDPGAWGSSIPSPEKWAIISSVLGLEASRWSALVDRVWRGRAGAEISYNTSMAGANYQRADKGEATAEAARQWAGWGTALKPALEPITVARKPLDGTVAANVLEHGTGALNVDGCRVGTDKIVTRVSGGKGFGSNFRDDGWLPPSESYSQTNSGRWPANLIHDGSDEVVRLFPQQSSGSRSAGVRKGMGFHGADGDGGPAIQGSSGSAARFFYCAKANKRDRGEGNNHPTVKPTDLMRYLCRLVTPPGGVVLDPFMGSGSTGKAAVAEGFRFIGIEREAEYLEIARRRIVEPDPEAAACQQGLF